MEDTKKPHDDLKDTVVRICLACGVVNPAGPSDSCPHLQLARFDGLDDSLSELLGDVADARRVYTELAAKLKERVKSALRNHIAEVETGRNIRQSQVDELSKLPSKRAEELILEPPPPPKFKPVSTRKKPRQRAPITVNPKQLDLIAREPPKGDA